MTLDVRAADARKIIREAVAASSAPCVTSSFQADCVALVQMVAEEAPGIPVLFLETGYHFPETYAYRDQMAERLKLNLVNVSSQMSVAEQESKFGILYQSAPDKCCGFRKVEPLF
jgi:phosphoadenosine phosphosulfate reductase